MEPGPSLPWMASPSPWQEKTTTFCVELTSHSPPPTPLLPALTLSAGEHQVSGGELKVSRTGGGPASQSTRSSLGAQNGLPLFLAAFSKSLSRGRPIRHPIRTNAPFVQ